MSERVRITVSIEPDVLAIFQKLADLSGMSLSKTIGDWCADTVEGAQFVTSKVVEAKKAPARVMREMHAMAKGMEQEVYALGREMSAQRRSAGGGVSGGGGPQSSPRPVTRGETPPSPSPSPSPFTSPSGPVEKVAKAVSRAVKAGPRKLRG